MLLRATYPFFMFALWSPRAAVNGYVIHIRWGDNYIPLPPGVHRISVWVPSLWRLGLAEITVDNRHGAPPPVFYAAPWFSYIRGAIAHQPVVSPGKALYFGALALTFFVVLCCAGSMILAEAV